MDAVVREAKLAELGLLLQWRMRVLHEVFGLPAKQPLEELEQENRRYYEKMIPAGGHIACFACVGERIVGCGGVCIYREMPSPDNPSGKCAYLMNIYTHPQFRGQGVGKQVVEWLVEQAAGQGIAKIYLETSGVGRRLYEESGFADMPDMMKFTDERMIMEITE